MLRKTVLSLKSPTGAFIAPLRCANANLFNKVQEKLAKNKKAPARHKAEESYLLTTKLYCGRCGALMFGESGVSHTGKMYTYYKCAAAKKKKTCDKKAVRKQWLEDLVVTETMKLVEDDASMNAIIAKVMELQNQESTDLPIYEKQLRETEAGITNMLNAENFALTERKDHAHVHRQMQGRVLDGLQGCQHGFFVPDGAFLDIDLGGITGQGNLVNQVPFHRRRNFQPRFWGWLHIN